MLIVPGRPEKDALTWWVMSPAAVTSPAQVRLEGGTPVEVIPIRAADLVAGDPPWANNARLCVARGLAPNTRYALVANPAAGDVGFGEAPIRVESRTLPAALAVGDSFTVAFGSCWCNAKRPPSSRSFFPPKVHGPDGVLPIAVRFLLGDQLYLDLSPSNGSPRQDAPDPWAVYLDQWRDETFRSLLAAAPTCVVPDDHELWNDYPHPNLWLGWERKDAGLADRMKRAYLVFQAPLNVRGNDASGRVSLDRAYLETNAVVPKHDLGVKGLSFRALDCRMERSFAYGGGVHQFASPVEMNALAGELATPGSPVVLLLPQPIAGARGSLWEKIGSWLGNTLHVKGDYNLPDYPAQFSELCGAVLDGARDVVVLTGDIHSSRLARIGHRTGRQVIEAVSSPLSRIPDLPLGLGAPSEGPAGGKVEWSGGSSSSFWTRDFADVSRYTYATAQFTRLSVGFRVTFRWYFLREGTNDLYVHEPPPYSIQ